MPDEDLEGLIQFADTFINELDDTEDLKKFRLEVGPKVIQNNEEADDSKYFDKNFLPKLKSMYENRIQDLINQLKSRDEDLNKLPLDNAIEDIRKEIQQLNASVSAYEKNYGENEKTILRTYMDPQLAKAQIAKTSAILKLVE